MSHAEDMVTTKMTPMKGNTRETTVRTLMGFAGSGIAC